MALTLLDFSKIILRRRKIFLITFLLSILISIIIFSILPKYYKSTVEILLFQREEIMGSMDAIAREYLDEEARIIKEDRKILEKTAETLGIDESKIRNIIEIKPMYEKDRICISAISQDKYSIAKILNTLAQVYIDKRSVDINIDKINEIENKKEEIERIKEKITNIEKRIKELKEKGITESYSEKLSENLQKLLQEESMLAKMYTSNNPRLIKVREEIKRIEKKLKEVGTYELELKKLNKELEELEEKQAEFISSIKKFESQKEGLKVGIISRPARVPQSPFIPNKRLFVIVGSVAGIILGLSFVFISENMDVSIKNIENIEEIGNLPILSIIPDKERCKNINDFIEQYNILYTNIKMKLSQIKLAGGSVIFFTSALPQEGKTTTAINSAISAGKNNEKVILIEIDMRKPTVDRILNISKEPGVTEIILKKVSWQDAIKTYSLNGKDIKVIPSGNIDSFIDVSLYKDEIKEFIEEVKKEYELIFIDSPPVIPFIDTIMLGKLLGGSSILVHRIGMPKQSIYRAKELLTRAGIPILGIVINKFYR
jgi:capsular exopolysaccharide synthesis family protein